MPSYKISPGMTLGATVRPYERKQDDPVTRPLRVFAVDPSVQKAEGCIATIHVPYEPLQPGPLGRLFEVECADGDILFSPLDLNSPRILINNGLSPSVPNPAFHQQMVYAVASSVYATFRSALGRSIVWGFDETNQTAPDGPRPLKLRPHVASEGANAGYYKEYGEIRFGYAEDRNLPGGRVFACLSHDIVAHEMTHALIDGIRSRFTIPTNGDVLGFHEGLSDLIALFHHFLYPEVLAAQIRKVGLDVERSGLLTRIAENFGLSAIGPAAIRSAAAEKLRYRMDLEPHEMGSVLLNAVFDAFVKIYRRKTERYIRLAGPQTPGFYSEDLVQILAEKASALARSFLDICIRGIDYCPPVDLELGEYLRAIVTADHSLVPDDPQGYREALIESFGRHGITPSGVIHLSEDALLWRGPARQLPPIAELSFRNLRFDGDPAVPASPDELRRQATALGAYVSQPYHCDEFGLMPADGDNVDPPCIQSIRTTRRVGPDGQVLFDLVAEVTQRRIIVDKDTGMSAKFVGGSTILIGPRGEFRYVISKNVQSQRRIDNQVAFQQKSAFWSPADGQYHLAGPALKAIHEKLERL